MEVSRGLKFCRENLLYQRLALKKIFTDVSLQKTINKKVLLYSTKA